MMRPFSIALGLVLASTISAASDDEETEPGDVRTLTDQDQRAPYLEALDESSRFQEATGRDDAARLPLCSMIRLPIGSVGASDAPDRVVVETLHFKYDEGVTIRSRIDAESREVVSVEKLRAYPTPLAPEELEEAMKLAREESDAVQGLFEEARDDGPKVTHLVPVISDPDNPRFGSRIVLLQLRLRPEPGADEPPGRGLTVEVNLTDRMVSNPL
ncbi:hypothetical protein AB1L88_02000 [Tautonia sp. JC769]|uniref:hypothetical protein n=1 Tax=Tautonia sp. JC769 TaxID=3232135 RepID=UPI003457DD64